MWGTIEITDRPGNRLEACMTKFEKYLAFAVSLAFLVPAALAQQSPTVTGDQASGYHMRVVSRSTEAVDYRHKGATKVNLRGTDLAADVRGEAKVEGKPGGVKLEADVEHLRPANSYGLAY